MTKPVLKILNGPSPTQAGVADAATLGLSPVISAMSQAVDLMPHTDPDLLHFLRFRRGIARQAASRARWFGGRLYNRMAGEDPDYVTLSGVHLGQALTACGLTAPDFIVPDGEYKLRLDHVERALAALEVTTGS